MSRFTYSNSVKSFNGSCTSKLLFDNKDGSTNRIFCTEDTCVTAILIPTGVTAPCNSVMKPSGYLLEKFDWGLEGGPWGPVNIDYGVLLASPNEFVGDGAKFIKPYLLPSGVAACAMDTDQFGRARFKGNAFNPGTWDIQDTSNAGYAQLAGALLNSKVIDPAAALGKNKYLPLNYYPDGCSVRATAYEVPDITYYDVGVDPIPPQPHDVVFENVAIPCGKSNPYSLFWEFVTEFAEYETCIKPYAGLCGVPYTPTGCPQPDMVALSGAWTYDPVLGGSNRSARSYFPTLDRDPTNIVTRGIRTDTTFVTGYRMQRYVQLFHTAKLTTSSASVSVGMRDIETRIRQLGYRAKWKFKSAEVNTVYISGNKQLTFYLAEAYYAGRGNVTIEVSYEKIPNPPSRATYEYGPYRDTVPVEYQRLYWSESYHEHEYEYIPVSPKYKKKYFNPPFQGWLREFTPTPYQTWPYPVINSSVTGTHYVIGQLGNVDAGVPAWYPAGQSHEHKPPFKSLTSVLTAKNYEQPLKWKPITPKNLAFQCSGYYRAVVDPTYISYFGQRFTRLGNVFYPKPAILYASFPGTPDNFKIWRKLITDGSSYSPGGDFSLGYSRRTEWFNGTCPFYVDYDNTLSGKVYSYNLCKTYLVPYIMPTG